MSRTSRQDPEATDNPRDFYETPGWAVRPLLDKVTLRGQVLDAGCGTGSILRELSRKVPAHRLMGLDIDPGLLQQVGVDCELICTDFLTWHGEPNNILMNPPFGGRRNTAQKFVMHALSLVPNGGLVAALLRLNWAASGQTHYRRADWLRAVKPSWVYALDRRPSFTGDGKTDASAYGWFVWNKGEKPLHTRWELLECER